jgi:energy-coupling factor transporter transmembrane protein EcfT
MIFFPHCWHTVFRLLTSPFVLFLPYFAFILPYYFPFYLFLSPLFLFLSFLFLLLLHFIPFSSPFHSFPPQMTSVDIPPQQGRYFPVYRPLQNSKETCVIPSFSWGHFPKNTVIRGYKRKGNTSSSYCKKTPKNSVLGRGWPLAKEKKLPLPVQHEFLFNQFGDLLWRRHVDFSSNFS